MKKNELLVRVEGTAVVVELWDRGISFPAAIDAVAFVVAWITKNTVKTMER